MGLDKHDADKVDDIPFSKEHGSALIDVALDAMHDYLKLGRKLSFPVTYEDETRMEISCVRAPERTSMGNRFKPDEASDTVTVTKERTIIKAKNPVPYWLKKTVEK